jgi:YidC/Oxa1 family membrane protein insertase
MDSKRAFLAIALSAIILLAYQYMMPKPPPGVVVEPQSPQSPPTAQPATESTQPPPQISPMPQTAAPVVVSEPALPESSRDIAIETSHFSALVSEAGGTIKSFRLKDYRESVDPASPPKELIRTEEATALPLFFSWGTEPDKTPITLYAADQDEVRPPRGGDATLTMHSTLPSGLQIIRSLQVADSDYSMQLTVDVVNRTNQRLQGAPYLRLVNRPFSEKTGSRYLFTGPAVLQDGALQEIKTKDLNESSKTLSGRIGWAAYENTYFMCAIIPDLAGGSPVEQASVHVSQLGDEKISTVVSSQPEILAPGGSLRYTYTLYFGPKRLSILKSAGHGLERIVNFGWWDFIAKPTLKLLNFLNGFVHNYGIAIILVTIIIKLLFWPIAQKGMKSMKTMQKLQPKMAKLREKYKDDKERLNQEMMQLYKTYKVNPVGGCLPMVLQIPVFFALYKVLLQTIELRHAPFMLWINDLSAPDRLFIGINIPVLGGIPVLTLLMGASMFLQQKMTPSTGDPTQAKIMMFLPVVFTFMFLNFASGLVLYWFVNNLLSIAQQYVINRQVETA